MEIRKFSFALFLCVTSLFPFMAQEPKRGASDKGTETSASKPERKGSAWNLGMPLGEHIPADIDTVSHNYQKQAIPSFGSPAWITTGNLGAACENIIFFQRTPSSDFFFKDPIQRWIDEKRFRKFYNVYIPMTILSYNMGGSKRNNQDRLTAEFAGNVNRRIGIGANMDYLYSKGAYESQATKDFKFGFSGYYKGDRYEMQTFFNQYNMLNKENGGIADDLYITDPAVLQGGDDRIDAKSIPTRLSAAHSRVTGKEFYMNHAFNVGYWREEAVNDTLKREVYVPVTKFIYTFDYRSNKHIFSNTNQSEGREFWTNRYLSDGDTYDDTRFWSISNTIGISMLEGFRKWVKFGLSAYATYEHRSFTQTPDTVNRTQPLPESLTPLPENFSISQKGTQDLLWIGALLAKSKGAILTYDASVKLGLVGDVAGDIEAYGKISTRIPLFRDTVRITAKGHFRNTAQPYFLQHYISNHFIWDNDFGKTRSFRVGGEIEIPFTRTRINVGMENIQNLVYFANDGLPYQHNGNIQLFTAGLEQNIKLGIWHWDNSIIYQTSSDKNILPLPALSIYSNMYIDFIAFRVLRIQFGVDCNYYTRYYAPTYQPATMQFCNQQELKIGNYPFMNAYLTCRLKRARFFVMMSHVNQGWFSKDYFAMPHYPLNPRKLQFGISIDFAN